MEMFVTSLLSMLESESIRAPMIVEAGRIRVHEDTAPKE